MKTRFLPVAVVVLAIASALVYWQSGDDNELTVPLAEPEIFTKVEDAERAAGFRIPTIRDLKGWKLSSIEVMGNGLYFSECEGRQDCKDPVGRMVILEYEPQAEGPTLAVRVLKSSRLALAVLPVVRPRPVDVPAGEAVLGVDQTQGDRWTNLHFRWVQEDVVISALASLLSEPARANFSQEEFLAMMRSMR